MKHSNGIIIVLGISLGAFIQSGCFLGNPSYTDYYSGVKEVCGYTEPGGSRIFSVYSDLTKTSLTPGCKEALEAIIPYDEESFENAPEGMKDHVTEAFQTMIGYPLAFPEKRAIFQTDPYAIPITALCIIAPQAFPSECYYNGKRDSDPDLNKNIFNYVMNRIDVLSYGKHCDDETQAAWWNWDKDLERGQMNVCDLFWMNEVSHNNGFTKFTRASTLIHESRHGDGIFHSKCPSDGTFSCDEDLSGPYGLEAIYHLMVIHGGAAIRSQNFFILSDHDLDVIGYDLCWELKFKVLQLPPELRVLLDSVECADMDHEWLLDNTNVSRF